MRIKVYTGVPNPPRKTKPPKYHRLRHLTSDAVWERRQIMLHVRRLIRRGYHGPLALNHLLNWLENRDKRGRRR